MKETTKETIKEQTSTQHNPTTKTAGQPVIQIRQNKLNRQHQVYSEQEHETVSLKDWSENAHAMQMAEEDMNDPDLAASFSSTRGYMLQPG